MSDSIFAIDKFVNVQPGEPFRLLPLGQLVKDGVKRMLTPELLAKFKLPHFKPPIKLGSHEDVTPAGGRIIGLELRDDGLYAIPELNDEGAAAFVKGAYAYHSPEIIWDGWLENPETGDKIEGPIIMGDALLHTPHLGEAAALYSVEVIDGGESDMTTNQDMVPVGALETLKNFFTNPVQPIQEPQEPQTPADPVETFEAEYQQAKQERDDLAAQVAELQQAQERDGRVAKYQADLGENASEELVGIFADLPEEQAEPIVTAFKALAAQAEETGLTDELGASGAQATGTVQERVNAAIDAYMAEHNVDRAKAAAAVAKEQPELLKE